MDWLHVDEEGKNNVRREMKNEILREGYGGYEDRSMGNESVRTI